MAAYHWRGELQEAATSQARWGVFEAAFVKSPRFSVAQTSQCQGFCVLGRFHVDKLWQHAEQSVYYRWERYDLPVEETEDHLRSYRLCASLNQLQYRCWWWRDNRLVTDGWVSVSD